MKILALEKDIPGASYSDVEPALHGEALGVWELVLSGTIREIYFREGPTQAVIIMEAEGTRQAEEVLAQLPLVKAGLTEFEVIGLRPYEGFSRLFRN
jgi:hypothetical protein